jgi:Ca2+-binding EF-hand superfamily protein
MSTSESPTPSGAAAMSASGLAPPAAAMTTGASSFKPPGTSSSSQGGGLPKKKRMPDTLTSAVYNEAELIFQILEHKEKHLISYLDCLTLLRGMGMNPTTTDMDELLETMKEPIAELEEKLREEEAKREKERRALEKKDPKKEKEEKARKEKEEKEKAEKDKAEADAIKEGAPPKKKPSSEPAEEIKNINWPIFINHVEPMYKDNETEVDDIKAALSVFDTTGKGFISRSDLLKALTENGESVLSPAEVKQLKEAFPDETLQFNEFALRLQGIYTGPSEDEKAAAAEEQLRREEEAKKAAAASAKDDLLSGVSLGGGLAASTLGEAPPPSA